MSSGMVCVPSHRCIYVVFFDTDKYQITDRQRKMIGEAAQDWKNLKNLSGPTTVYVDGYIDSLETDVSKLRAAAVKTQLIADGVDAKWIVATGHGTRGLLIPTDPGVPHPLNRRVQIHFR